MIKIYHNPRCSKSRATLQILEEKSLDFETIKYLETPLKKEELQNVLKELNLKPSEFARSGEGVFKELNLKTASEDEIFGAMLENPILIERPIVITPKGIRIGRPPESILEIL
jgi:arsenate reductase